MKKLLTTLAVAAMLSAPASAISVGAGGGYALGLPIGDFGDAAELSFIGFGGKFMVGVMPNLDIEVGVNYHMKFKAKFEGTEPTNADDYYTTLMPIKFGIAYKLPVGPVVIAPCGGGAYVMATPHVPDNMPEPDSDNNIGFYFGAAIKYPITPMLNFYVAPDFLYVMSEDEEVAGSYNAMAIELPIGIEYWFM